MKKIFKVAMMLFVLVSFLTFPSLGLAEEDTTGEEVKKEEKKEEAKKESKLEEIVVTATKTETPIEHIADSVTIVTAEEIEQKGQATVYDVLKDIPGLTAYQCGGPGNYTKVRMRGGEDRHIKLLVNGMAVGDYATGLTQHYDLWNFLGTEDIERIEVVRGPQSALYGSDAISGVINIITKKGRGKPKFFIKSEAGSMDIHRESAGVNGSIKNFSYNLTASHNENGGVLRYSEFESDMISTTFGYQFNKDTELNLSIQQTHSDLNQGGQTNTTTWKIYDDPHCYRTANLFFSNLALKQRITSFWEHKLTVGYDKIEKKHNDFDDGVLDVADNITDSPSDGLMIIPVKKVYWQNNISLGKIDTLTAGVEYEDSDMDRQYTSSGVYSHIEKSITTKSVYLQNQLLLLDEDLSFICGGRLDDNSAFGNHGTYNFKLAYLLRDYGTKLKATYGTGIAAPSLLNLYHYLVGNPDLKPEESKGWTVGFEQNLFQDRVVLEATYFDNKFKNLIDVDYSIYQYVNREKAESHGAEVLLKVFPLKDITVSANYTFTEGEEDDKDLVSVPRDRWGFNVTYAPGKFTLNADFYYVGDRLTSDQKEEHRLDSYNLVNIAASYQINKYLKIFGRVENLFDEDYTPTAIFKAPGICGYAGVKVTF